MAASSFPPFELTVVVPTLNERENAGELARLEVVPVGLAWELIVVDDDSPDGTAAAVKALAQQDARVRCIRRIGRRGLAGACLEGILASAAPAVAVMDADLVGKLERKWMGTPVEIYLALTASEPRRPGRTSRWHATILRSIAAAFASCGARPVGSRTARSRSSRGPQRAERKEGAL
jgi:glycosyltransferase involved in cell wall biosynthesis